MDAFCLPSSGDQSACNNNIIILNQGSGEQTFSNLPFYINDAEQPIGFVTVPSNGALQSNIQFSLQNLSPENSILPSSEQEKSFESTQRSYESEDVKPPVGLVPASSGDTFAVVSEDSNINVLSGSGRCSGRNGGEQLGSSGVTVTQAVQPRGSPELPCDKDGYKNVDLLSCSFIRTSQAEGTCELTCDENCYSNVVHVPSSSLNFNMVNGILPSNGHEEDCEFTPRDSEMEDVKPLVCLAPEHSNLEPNCGNPPHGNEKGIQNELTDMQNEGFYASESVSESSNAPSTSSENSSNVTMSCNNIGVMEISVYFDPECSRSAEVLSSQSRTSNVANPERALEIQEATVPAQDSQSGESHDILCYGLSSANQLSSSPLEPGMLINSNISTMGDPRVNGFQHQPVIDNVTNLVLNSPAPDFYASSSSQPANRSRNICPYCQKWFRSDNLNHHILVVHSTFKPFKCQICPKEFAAEFDLNKHVERHTKLTCPYCTEVFLRGRSLLKHAVLQHKDKDLSSLPLWSFKRNALPCSSPGHFSCSSCLVEYDSLRACLDHCVRSHFFKECWVCQRLFEKETQLKRHIKTHTGERTFPCDHCDRSFFTDAERRMHLKRLTLEKSVMCSVCDKGFKTQAQRDRHVLTHSNDKPYQCTSCTKTFKSQKAYGVHVRLHTGEMPFECQYCEQGFRSWRRRQSHQMKDHPDLVPRKEYNCSYCLKSYSNSSSFASHVKRHTGQVLRCTSCTFVTVSKENLDIHMNSHTGAKPYKCRYCPIAYGQPNRLTIHERSHTGEKPYACDQCDKAFVDKYSLVRHVRIHTGEKPYKCSYCDKAFAQGCQLQFHERTHTGEKPYECSQCEKKFTRRQELNKHIETHKKRQQGDQSEKKAAEENYECTSCKKKFSSQQELSKHLETHQKRQQLVKRKRKQKIAESDSGSEFSDREVEDLGQNKEERLASLRSAKIKTRRK